MSAAPTFLERVAAQVETTLATLRAFVALGGGVKVLTIAETSELQTTLSSVCTVLNEQFLAIPASHAARAATLRCAIREHARIRYTTLGHSNAVRIAELLADALPVIGATIAAERRAAGLPEGAA